MPGPRRARARAAVSRSPMDYLPCRAPIGRCATMMEAEPGGAGRYSQSLRRNTNHSVTDTTTISVTDTTKPGKWPKPGNGTFWP